MQMCLGPFSVNIVPSYTWKSRVINTVNVTRISVLLVYDQDALKHPWCDLVYLTDVMAEFDCDVFFPEFDRGLFKLQERYVLIS